MSVTVVAAGLALIEIVSALSGFLDRRQTVFDLDDQFRDEELSALKLDKSGNARGAIVASELDQSDLVVSADAEASLSQIQQILRSINKSPITIDTERNAPGIISEPFSAVRTVAALRNVPVNSLAQVVGSFERATPPILIESIRIMGRGIQNGSVPRAKGSDVPSVDVTATLRSYYVNASQKPSATGILP